MAAPLAGLLVCGIAVAGEFALDGKILPDLSKSVIYGVMALSLIGLAVLEPFAHKASVNVKVADSQF